MMYKAIVFAVLVTGIAAQYEDICAPWQSAKDFRSLFKLGSSCRESPPQKRSMIIRKVCGPPSNNVAPPEALCLRTRSDISCNEAQPETVCYQTPSESCNRPSPPQTICFTTGTDPCNKQSVPQPAICFPSESDPCGSGGSQGLICFAPGSSPSCEQPPQPQQPTICLTPGDDPCRNGPVTPEQICFTAERDPCCHQAPPQQTICLPPVNVPSCNPAPPSPPVCITRVSDPCCNPQPPQSVCITSGNSGSGNGGSSQGSVCFTTAGQPGQAPQTICLPASSDSRGNEGSSQYFVLPKPSGSPGHGAPGDQRVIISESDYNRRPVMRGPIIYGNQNGPYYQVGSGQRKPVVLRRLCKPYPNEQGGSNAVVVLGGQGSQSNAYENPFNGATTSGGHIHISQVDGQSQPHYHVTPGNSRVVVHSGQGSSGFQGGSISNGLPVQRVVVVGQSGGSGDNEQPGSPRVVIGSQGSQPHYHGPSSNSRIVYQVPSGSSYGQGGSTGNGSPVPRIIVVGPSGGQSGSEVPLISSQGGQPHYHVTSSGGILPHGSNPHCHVHCPYGPPSCPCASGCHESPVQRVFVIGQPGDSGCGEQPAPQECVIVPQPPQPHCHVIPAPPAPAPSVCVSICNDPPAPEPCVIEQPSEPCYIEQPAPPTTIIVEAPSQPCNHIETSEEVCSEPIQICMRSSGRSSNVGDSLGSALGGRPYIKRLARGLINPLVRRCRQTRAQSSSSSSTDGSSKEPKTFFFDVDKPCSCMNEKPVCTSLSSSEE
ncbi:SH3 and multiple ankyrin repeat domains protein 1-like [Diachasmimorpha longicaudata]|uniref:SH3 and multiple ankyrin repeat domains protein 1-like n=1 Tax=Diachasmimorpha longicaudata TaxID=58733 RepID=UPI0030B8DC82